MLADDKLLSIIKQEISQAKSFGPVVKGTGSNKSSDLEQPLSYYLGLPNGTEVEGRSKVTSTDVADAIEWILPQIMKALTSTNEVVMFDAVDAGDEEQAELETSFVYDILMKQNDGFILLHQAIKDALLHKFGLLKVYFEEYSSYETETYTGLLEDQYNLLLQDTNISLVKIESSESSEYGIDVTIKRKAKKPKICIDAVPPEQFMLSADHRSVNLKSSRFTCHTLSKTVSDLRQEGISDKVLEEIAESSDNPSSFRDELSGATSLNPTGSDDKSQKLISINECYMFVDLDEDGIAEYVKITTAGVDSPIVVLSKESLDFCPWVNFTAILMSHQFEGLSIYDRLKEIQDQKTAIMRNTLDNMYLTNNNRLKVIESQVQIDDLLVSRSGGLIRVKNQDAVQELIVQQLGDMPLKLLGILDEARAGRVGVAAEGAAAPQNIGDRVGSQGVNQLMTAKEELVGLIIRVVAEVGLKPLCLKIRDLACRHYDLEQSIKFKGRWLKVNPTSWVERSSTTIRVGTGSGDKQEKLAALQNVLLLQEKLSTLGVQYLIDETRIFNTINDLCKMSGLVSADRYFVDPGTEQGQAAKQAFQQQQQQMQQQQMQQEAALAQAQLKIADAEGQKAKAQMDNVTLKGQVESAKHLRELQKQEYETRIASLEAKLKEVELLANGAEKDEEIKFKYAELDQKTFVELTKITAEKDIKLIEASMKEKEPQPQQGSV